MAGVELPLGLESRMASLIGRLKPERPSLRITENLGGGHVEQGPDFTPGGRVKVWFGANVGPDQNPVYDRPQLLCATPRMTMRMPRPVHPESRVFQTGDRVANQPQRLRNLAATCS
jgi:hypothetical protein